MRVGASAGLDFEATLSVQKAARSFKIRVQMSHAINAVSSALAKPLIAMDWASVLSTKRRMSASSSPRSAKAESAKTIAKASYGPTCVKRGRSKEESSGGITARTKAA